MEILKNGQRIKHTTQPEWGLGQLLADENATQIPLFFVNHGLVNFSAQARHKLELVVGT